MSAEASHHCVFVSLSPVYEAVTVPLLYGQRVY